MTTPTCPSAPAVNALAQKWAAAHPALSDRIFRAVALVPNVVPSEYTDDQFFVEGQTDNYTVTVDREHKISRCSCPDHQKRNDRCKHILACALFEACQGK